MSRVKPGWFVLAAVTVYAVVVTVLLATREPAAVVADTPTPSPEANVRAQSGGNGTSSASSAAA